LREIDQISGQVIDIAIRLHKALGPGLMESVYVRLLAAKLAESGLNARTEVPIDIEFEGIRFEAAFRADIVINDQLIVEIKSVEKLSPVHAKQLLTYLRLTKQPVGLLINFGGATLIEGVKRLVNNY
jgi:GxxExxY protein